MGCCRSQTAAPIDAAVVSKSPAQQATEQNISTEQSIPQGTQEQNPAFELTVEGDRRHETPHEEIRTTAQTNEADGETICRVSSGGLPVSPGHEEEAGVDVNADARVLADISRQLEDIVESVKSRCQDRRKLNLLDAEKAFMDAIDALDLSNSLGRSQRLAALDKLRNSREYKEVLSQLKAFEGKVRLCLEDDTAASGVEWKLAATVPIDYKALGMELTPEAEVAVAKEDRTLGIYHRTIEGKIHVRIHIVTPIRSTNYDSSTPFSAVTMWNALMMEFPLWHTYHPLVAGNGPVELTPPSAPHYNLIHVMLKVFLFKKVNVIEQSTIFNFESGMEMFCMDEAPRDSQLRAQYPAPDGYKMEDNVIDNITLVVPQQHTVFWATQLVLDLKLPPPQWLFSWFLSWVLPEIIRRQFKVAVKNSKDRDSQHMVAIREDSTGLYARIRELVDKCAERNERPYTPKHLPSADVIAKRARSLTHFEEHAASIVEQH